MPFQDSELPFCLIREIIPHLSVLTVRAKNKLLFACLFSKVGMSGKGPAPGTKDGGDEILSVEETVWTLRLGARNPPCNVARFEEMWVGKGSSKRKASGSKSSWATSMGGDGVGRKGHGPHRGQQSCRDPGLPCLQPTVVRVARSSFLQAPRLLWAGGGTEQQQAQGKLERKWPTDNRAVCDIPLQPAQPNFCLVSDHCTTVSSSYVQVPLSVIAVDALLCVPAGQYDACQFVYKYNPPRLGRKTRSTSDGYWPAACTLCTPTLRNATVQLSARTLLTISRSRPDDRCWWAGRVDGGPPTCSAALHPLSCIATRRGSRSAGAVAGSVTFIGGGFSKFNWRAERPASLD